MIRGNVDYSMNHFFSEIWKDSQEQTDYNDDDDDYDDGANDEEDVKT